MRFLFTCLIGLSCTSPLAAEETYRIRLRTSPDVGKTNDQKVEDSMETRWRFIDDKGKEVRKELVEIARQEEYAETVLKADKDKVIQFQRLYRKARDSHGKKEQKAGHDGQTILFEKAEKGWRVTYKGGKKLPDGDRLSEEAEDKWLLTPILPLLPGKAVKVGEKWRVDAKAVQASARHPSPTSKDEVEVKLSKTAGGKLVKVYRKGKRLFGVMEIEAEVDFVSKGKSGTHKLAIKVNIDAVIDGSDTQGSYKWKMDSMAKAIVEQDGKKTTFNATTKGVREITVSPEK